MATGKHTTKVLLVDDEPEFLNTLGQRLKLRGLAVVTANCGGEAIRQIQDEEFDAVIMDLHMPGIDGLETIRRIKRLHPKIGIIMLSGDASVQLGIELMQLGVIDLLPKPVEIGLLVEKIAEAVVWKEAQASGGK